MTRNDINMRITLDAFESLLEGGGGGLEKKKTFPAEHQNISAREQNCFQQPLSIRKITLITEAGPTYPSGFGFRHKHKI